MFGSRPRPAAAVLACIAFVGLYMLVAGLPTASAARVGDSETGLAFDPHRGLSTSSRSNSRTNSLTIASPSALGGEMMVAAITVRLPAGAVLTPPADWTLIRRDSNIGGSALTQGLYYKLATAFEPASYTWRFSAAAGATGGITAFTGVDAQNPVEAHAGLYSANTRLIAAPSVTTSVNGAL